MIGIDARTDITFMENAQAFGDRSIGKKPSHSMSAVVTTGTAADAKHAISSLGTDRRNPNPAPAKEDLSMREGTLRVNFRPKSMRWWGKWSGHAAKIAQEGRIFKLFLGFVFLLLPSLASAQMGSFSTILLSGSGQPIGGAHVAVCSIGLTTTGASVTNNIATLTMSSNPITAGFLATHILTVSGFSGGDTFFNVTTTITAVSATTISFPLTHGNASAGTNGKAFQTGDAITPCAPLVTLYTDDTGTTTSANPFTSDSIGNVSIWAPSGIAYQVQYYGQNVVTKVIEMSIGLTQGSTITTLTVTNLTVSGTGTFANINNILVIDGNTYPTCAAAITAAGSVNKTIILVPSTYAGAECPTLTSVDGYNQVITTPNITIWDFRGSANGHNLDFNSTVQLSQSSMSVSQYVTSAAGSLTSSALLTTNQITGTFPTGNGTLAGFTSEASITGPITIGASASHVSAIEGYTAIRSTGGGGPIANVYGGVFSVNLDRATSTTNVTNASSVLANACTNVSSTATIVNCYSLQASQPTVGTTRNYAAFFNGSVLMPNNVNFDSVNSSGTAARFITFNVDNTTAFRPRGTDQAGEFQWTDTTATIPIMTLGTSGGAVLAGVCKSNPAYRWHVECPTAGDVIAKFKNTSATGYGVSFVPGLDTNYGIAVKNAADTLTNFDVLGNGTVQLAGTIQNPAGTSTMGLTLKKGSGGGNYTNATTSYTVADSTNLCFTVTIPTGWKLGVSASGALATATAAVVAQAALTDNAACSTANAGIIVETAPIQGAAIAVADSFALNWVITGDGAAHNVALQFKTSNAADTASLINSSATITPTMKFELQPSN